MGGIIIIKFHIKKSLRATRLLIFIAAAILLLMLLETNRPKNINHANLLDTVAKGESNGNYNAYYGNAHNKSIDFTAMTVNEVLAWQSDYVKKGSRSSAVGKYQFIRPTLDGLMNELGIKKDAIFNQALQDRLAVALLERRGLNDYMSGKITLEQYAHNLSKEWAALPRIIGKDPDASYYAGDGLNKVRVSKADIYRGIATLHN
ncbi:hypothetical protein KY385_04690 [Candidatus Parcubacteria bacterium]|nr:hypothetical protein [Candidatus Parcubacteria bacterium]